LPPPDAAKLAAFRCGGSAFRNAGILPAIRSHKVYPRTTHAQAVRLEANNYRSSGGNHCMEKDKFRKNQLEIGIE
jgi:hypothetical protein